MRSCLIVPLSQLQVKESFAQFHSTYVKIFFSVFVEALLFLYENA